MDDNPVHSPETSNRLQALEALLNAGADPNAPDTLGRAPVHHAAAFGDGQALKLLLNAGADVNAQDAMGRTPLMMAVNPAAMQFESAQTAFGMISLLGTRIWKQLQIAHELAITFSEETITDNTCLALAAARLPEIKVYKVSKPRESETGVDIELYVGSDKDGWWVYLVQAKRVEVVRECYRHVLHTRHRDGKYQFELLEEHAKARKAIPLYGLYSFVYSANEKDHYHCNIGTGISLLGWTLAATKSLRGFISSGTIPTFDDLHKPIETLPARCLFCSRLANAKDAKEHPLAGDFLDATRIASLPQHLRSQEAVNDSAQLLLGDWVIVVDSSKSAVVPCPRNE